MRKNILIITACVLFLSAAPVLASLPFYNADVGYTIWLPGAWVETAPRDIEHAAVCTRSLPIQGAEFGWDAGYMMSEGGNCLLVELRHGRKMSKADISNFNHFIVRAMKRPDVAGSEILRNATYFKDKKILRLESEIVHDDGPLLGLTYVVYTRKGMLTFVGYVDPADEQVKATIDKAVLSLYLDDGIRYDTAY